MERLTDKYGTTSCDNVSRVLVNGTDNEFVIGGKAVAKLKELEDLMKLYHCNDIDELKNKLENWKKLKKWVRKKMNTCPEYEWFNFEEVLCEMKDLEKGE